MANTCNREISPVTDNYDKQRTYKIMLGRYRAAMKHEFYFEAILIDYAMMEDRLRSFIYHLGGFSTRKSHKIEGKAKNYLKEIVKEYNPKGNLGVNSITGKMQIIKAVILWAESLSVLPDDTYHRVLKSKIEDLDIEALLNTFDSIDNWRIYRNECIHSVMNKNMISLEKELASKCEEGMVYARLLDSQVRILKKGNRIRKSLHLKD